MITQTADLTPGQVEVVATANLTIGFRFSGFDLGSYPRATVKALHRAFADVALGFNPSLIMLSPVPPPAASLGDTLASGDAVTASSPPRRLRRLRRLLQLPGDGSATNAAARLHRIGHARRLMQWAAAVPEDQLKWGDTVYAAYTGMSPSSIQMLVKAVQLSCGDVGTGDTMPGRCITLIAGSTCWSDGAWWGGWWLPAALVAL